jgi:hypothetical protein
LGRLATEAKRAPRQILAEAFAFVDPEGGGELIGVSMSLLDSPFFERVQPDAFKIARRRRG